MMSAQRLEKLIIVAVALHSMLVGVGLLTRPAQILLAVGWDYAGPAFFPHQSGVFHIILAAVYLTALRHRVLAWILVGAKTTALMFLLAEYIAGNGPLVLILMGVADGLMGFAVAVILVWNMRSDLGRCLSRAM